MAFWGVEIKPETPYNHLFDETRGRLHISQATLGNGTSSKKSLVQCIVGYNSPVLLCSLLPDKTESCPLDFEFEEVDVVTFSVIGPRSVHLTGYYLDKPANFNENDDESDSYGEDVGESESEESTDYDMDDEYDDDFIDDIDDGFDLIPSTRTKSGVVIEEILDDEKYVDGDDRKQIIVNGGTSSIDTESEDEDGLPKYSLSKTDNESGEARKKSDKKVSKGKKKKKAEDGGDRVTGMKRKIEDIQEGKTERGTENRNDSAVDSLEAGQENFEKPEKKKKKERTKEGKSGGDRDDSINDDQKEDNAQTEEGNTDVIKRVPVCHEADDKASNNKNLKSHGNGVSDEDTTTGKKKKKKKKNKKNKTPESDKSATADEANKGSVVEIEDKKAELKATQARNYPNGLVVEEIKMGKPDGKKASPGKTVYVHYIGKLKKNDKIFDSNVGRVPFKFRLGVGQVIKGWDVGVNGMRIGDKRRLTIPPSMGYGSQGSPPAIPPNAWLLFDVELVNVR